MGYTGPGVSTALRLRSSKHNEIGRIKWKRRNLNLLRIKLYNIILLYTHSRSGRVYSPAAVFVLQPLLLRAVRRRTREKMAAEGRFSNEWTMIIAMGL